MSEERAATLVRRLIAGFPYLNAHDPKGYATALVEVMKEYPTWAGERAIVRVDEEKPEFPPSDRLLRTWLDDAVRPWRYAQQWQVGAVQQLRERDEMESCTPAVSDQPSGETYTNFTDATAQHGRPFGPFERGRAVQYRG